MSSSKVLLRGLLVETKDGEWGKDAPFDGSVEMHVIRGTDFDTTRGGAFDGVPVRQIAGKAAARKSLQPGDILIETAGGSKGRPTGRTVFLRSKLFEKAALPVTCASFARFMRVDSNLAEPEFVYWYLQFLYSNGTIENHQVQHTGIARFQFTKFAESTHIELPERSAQQEIVGFLGALDDRITLLRETNATLETIAQALFKSWFVDFDPVRAKQEGRVPEGMDDATAALFPDGFEETESGLVPKGWQLVPFGQLVSHTIGGDWGGEEPDSKNDTRVAIIRGTDIPDLQSGANSRVPIRYTSAKKLASRKLQHGDIILEVSGGSKDQPTGRALYLTDRLLQQFDCPVEPASFCRLLRPKSEDVGMVLGLHLSYIYAQGKTWEYQNQSTGIANFQTTHFLETELVAVPCDEVLSEFASIVRPMIERLHLTQAQKLGEIRDALLPRLICGQLRLPGAEAEALAA
ncbi:restriction endonuclease subunit S [Cupriavidus sp. SZY C1]|uniref:restriction endonuclease subunit S n=1 Tax=Cupriavidus sp. SZY C1 TaxID=3055037 RepID=UPI0028B8296A|nr:restriction endonuclease subunit S [Cupriavidus sp. SZY C1]MDT6962254.1 restriction endonuclease subunit S [Cupriavidus sp. SZY C1]